MIKVPAERLTIFDAQVVVFAGVFVRFCGFLKDVIKKKIPRSCPLGMTLY
jgi:hypothetical protein